VTLNAEVGAVSYFNSVQPSVIHKKQHSIGSRNSGVSRKRGSPVVAWSGRDGFIIPTPAGGEVGWKESDSTRP